MAKVRREKKVLLKKDVLKGIHLSATKCTNILRQGLGLHFSKQLVDILRETYFSIIPDEKSVRSVTRFFDMEEV